jgi:hypothetical protein
MSELSWKVSKDPKTGKIERRTKDDNGNELPEDHIDFEWCHTSGFAQGHVLIPKTHPPYEQIEKKLIGEKKRTIKDELVVPRGTDDKIIEGLLNEMKKRFARAHKIEGEDWGPEPEEDVG